MIKTAADETRSRKLATEGWVSVQGYEQVKAAALAREEQAIRNLLPAGLSLTRISDQATVIEASIDEFMLKFVTALAVVVGVLTLLFLRSMRSGSV